MVFGLRLFGGGGGARSHSHSAGSSGSASPSAASVPPAGSPNASSSLSALDPPGASGSGGGGVGGLPRGSTAATSIGGGAGGNGNGSVRGGSRGGGGALTTADSTPPDAAVCPPLNAISHVVLTSHPELALSSYNLTKPELCINVLAIVHNAARLEMADMCGDILPCLRARGAAGVLDHDDMQDLRKWWAGFARFICTSSLVEDMVVKKAFEDVYVGFRKETRAVEKLFHRVQEKNTVYLELAVKKMANAVEDLAADIHDNAVIGVAKAWNVLYNMLTDIYTMSEDLVTQIDRFGADPLEYKDLEKSAARIYTQRKRWSDRDEDKRGEMIVILTRWMADEAFMRNWMSRYLPRTDVLRANKWMDEYRANRLVLVDRFHQKKIPHGAAGNDTEPEITVRGPAFSSPSAVIA